MKPVGKGKKNAWEFDENTQDLEISDSDGSQFVPEDGDSEELWSVKEILAEKNGKYLIKWDGVDTDGKPWDDSWVPRRDVTDDLVVEWKRKKASVKKDKERSRNANTAKRADSKASRSSVASTVRMHARQSSGAAPHSSSTSHSTSMAEIGKDALEVRKRKKAMAEERTSDVDVQSSPRKRRRTNSDWTSSVATSPKRATASFRAPPVSENLQFAVEQTVSIVEGDSLPLSTDIYDDLPIPPPDRFNSSSKVSKPAVGSNGRLGSRRGVNDRNASASSTKLPVGPSPKHAKVTRARSSKSRALSNGHENTVEEDTTGLDLEAISPSKRLKRGLLSGMKKRKSHDTLDGGTLRRNTSPAPEELMERDAEILRSRSSTVRNTGNPRMATPLVHAGGELQDLGGSDYDEKAGAVDRQDYENTSIFNDTLKSFGQTDILDISDNARPVKSVLKEMGATQKARQDKDFEETTVPYNGTVIPETQRTLSQPLLPLTSSGFIKGTSQEEQHFAAAHETDSLAEPGSSFEALAGPSNAVGTNGKELKPIPNVTPGKFKAHLPSLKPLTRFLPVFQSKKKKDVPSSSIESNMSRRKQASLNDTDTSAGEDDSADMEAEDEIEDVSMPPILELPQRGLQLAEETRALQRANHQAGLLKPLDTIISDRRSKSNSMTSQSHSPVLLASHEPASSRDVPSHDVDALVQQMEEDYMDFQDGAAKDPSNDADASAEEDEEQLPGSEGSQDVSVDEATRGGVASPDDSVEEDDTASAVRSLNEKLAEREIMDEEEARGESHVDDAVGSIQGYPPTTATTHQDDDLHQRNAPWRSKVLGSAVQPEDSVIPTPTRTLDSALNLLNKKSEEIALLYTRLAEGDDNRRQLLERNAQLEAEKSILLHQQSQPQMPEQESADPLELAELRESHDTIVKERDTLIQEVNKLKTLEVDLESNLEMYKSLFDRASTFAETLKQENLSLETRVLLAEGQVSKGLQLVRAQATAQLKKTQEELEKSQSLVDLLTEKDRRTNDEIRRKAAREPELIALIDELREEKAVLKGDLANIVRLRNELLVEKQSLSTQLDESHGAQAQLQDELRGLRVELARFSARERSIKKMIDLSTPLDQDADAEGELGDPGEEEVYICSWVVDNNAERCGELLLSRQDLQDHLFLAGHL